MKLNSYLFKQSAASFMIVSMTICMSGLFAMAQDPFVELSHYILPDFARGTVFMKSGMKQETILNYNALTEEMLFRDKGQMLAIGNDAVRNIDSIVINNRTFIPVNEKFFELLVASGNQLYAEYKCQISMPGKSSGYGGTSQTTAITSISSIQADGLLYQLKLPDDFKIKPYTNYWIKKNGEFIKFVNMRQLRRIYENRETMFDDFVKEHHVKYDNQKSLVLLVRYMESAGK